MSLYFSGLFTGILAMLVIFLAVQHAVTKDDDDDDHLSPA